MIPDASQLDDYLKMHHASKVTTSSASQFKQYDFSAVDSLDSEPNNKVSANTLKTDETFTMDEVAPKPKTMPKKELQAAVCPLPQRRRDRKASISPSPKPEEKAKEKAKPTNKRSKSPFANTTESAPRNQARLGDLCPEDKSKIGELVKKLASETKMREDSVSRFEKEKMEFEGRFNQM